MTPDEFAYVQQLFLELSDKPLDIQREKLTLESKEVRSEVLSLIEADKECSDFLVTNATTSMTNRDGRKAPSFAANNEPNPTEFISAPSQHPRQVLSLIHI